MRTRGRRAARAGRLLGVGAVVGLVTSLTTVVPAGAAKVPTADLPGWTPVFSEDFSTPVAAGAFPGPYEGRWSSYDGFVDHTGNVLFDQRIISAHGGVLDLHLHAEDGMPLAAAPVPWVDGQWGGQTYGRYSVRMKADALAGYGATFLLWPDSEDWNDGEIDFPESGLDDVVKGYNHCPGNPRHNCLAVTTSATYDDWHVYTIEWAPKRLAFLVDGDVVASTTTHIPTKPLHWVMQVGAYDKEAAASNSGHLLLDWVTIHRRA